MEKSIVINKINQMPEQLMGIVADFIDKLVQGYELGLRNESELTEQEKQEILSALAEYEANPESGIDWGELKAELTEKYEL